MTKRITLLLTVALLLVGYAVSQAPEFKYVAPGKTVFWSPPTEFGPIPADQWKPPVGFEKYAQAWAPPDWWGEPEEWQQLPEL